MFNRSRWAKNCTVTPLFYICCYGAFLFMIKKLEDCNVGDLVRIWCIGTLCWDDEVVRIIDKSVLITVQYQSGKTGRFSSSAECKVVSF